MPYRVVKGSSARHDPIVLASCLVRKRDPLRGMAQSFKEKRLGAYCYGCLVATSYVSTAAMDLASQVSRTLVEICS